LNGTFPKKGGYCLEIQNLIKINQINSRNIDPSQGLLRSQQTGDLFNRILAIFTNVLQPLDARDNQTKLPLQENEILDGAEPKESVSECSQEENLWQLVEMLSDLLAQLNQNQQAKIETEDTEISLHTKTEVELNQLQPIGEERENNEIPSSLKNNLELNKMQQAKLETENIDMSLFSKIEVELNREQPTSIHTENLNVNQSFNERKVPLPPKWLPWLQPFTGDLRTGIVQLFETVIENSPQQAIETMQLTEKINQFLDQINGRDNYKSQDFVNQMQLVLDRLNTSIMKSHQIVKDNGKAVQSIQKSRVSLDKNEVFSPINGLSIVGNRVPVMDTNYVPSNQNPVPKMSLSHFVPEMESWIGQFKLQHGQFGSAKAQFLLTPDHLGRMEVIISTQDGNISARIVTETAAAKEALEGQLQQLKQVLQQQGIQIQKMEIIQTPASTDINQWGFSFSHDGSFNHSKQEKGKNQITQGGSNKLQEVDQEISYETAMSNYGYGPRRAISSIDFTA
jgi:flagellar hook-length control protein FliK